MQIAGFEFPNDLYYDRQHNWARVEGSTVVQGLTDLGQKLAREIVYAEIPPVGRVVSQGQTFMSLESGKWVGRVPAMVSGKILAVNEELEFEPSLINQSPFDQGWLVKIEMSNPTELNNLLRADSPEFQSFVEGEVAKYKDILG